MDEERQRLLEEIAQLRHAMMEFHAHKWRGEWVELDLTIGQLRALFALFGQPALRMSDVAHNLGIALPSCTSLVDRLVKAGLVERQEDPFDRRLVLCALSKSGTALVTKLQEGSAVLSDELLRYLTTQELRTVADAVSLLSTALASLREAQGNKHRGATTSSNLAPG